MKFIHTADWQIGMKASHIGTAGARVREERLKTIVKITEIARIQNVEFILVAGDTFEDNAVDRILIQKVVDHMDQSPVPVYVIPGNHDPHVPGSVWEHPAWDTAKQVHILFNPEPVEIPGGKLYPCPTKEKYSLSDPTVWIQDVDSSVLCIGLAHGTVEGIQAEPDAPIPRDAAFQRGLDYLALGHWHSYAKFEDKSGAIRMAYSGTHETTKFGERESGNVLLVEIEEPHSNPHIQVFPTGGLRWRVIESDVRETQDVLNVKTHVETLDEPQNTLLDVRLSGLLQGDAQEEISRIQEILSSRFLYSNLDISRLRPSPQDSRWIEVLPAGYIREAGLQLKNYADPEYMGEYPEGVNIRLASRALLELYAMAKEAGR